ncbi:MAG: DUF1549 and DUF1553 domain-containing protein [Limisphaerales bacterium]
MSRWTTALWAVVFLVLGAFPVAVRGDASRTETGTAQNQNHWAFRVLSRPAIPGIVSPERARTPVDRFLEVAAAVRGLSMGPEADRATLIRRVALTVTGLPPSPEEAVAFLSDHRPGAYERMVERYLGSERFGERWGKLWLDAAGYADSNGYFNADTDRPLAYRYRDYVIRSTNDDVPFDRFVREQIAGDELSGWRPGEPADADVIAKLVATHFLRNGQDGSGESDGNPDEVRVDRYHALESTMQILGSCLLGVTVQCAKCHDHKFEPFSQEDYYAFQAFLYPAFHIEKWVKPNERVITAALPGEREAWKASEARLDARRTEVEGAFRNWYSENRIRGRVLFEDGFDEGSDALTNRWSNTAPGDQSPGGTVPVSFDPAVAPSASIREGSLVIREGGGAGDRWLSTRQAFPWRPSETGAWIQVTFDLKAIRLDEDSKDSERVGYFIAMHDFDDSSAISGGNLLIDGNPAGASQVHVDYPGADSKGRGEIGGMGYKAGRNYGVRVTRASDDDLTLEHLVDGAPDGRTLNLRSGDLTDGGFGFEYCCGRSFVVDNVRVEVADLSDPDWVKRQDAFRVAEEDRRRNRDAELKEVARARAPEPGRIAWVSDVVAERPSVPLLKRGNPKTPGEPVEPTFPAFLGGAGSGAWVISSTNGTTTGLRTKWAEWLTAPGGRASSLLARVAVNRIWQAYFGEGLVSTPDNLGISGARPTHPELLEWLASEFVASGWSQKAIHRLIVNSAAFRRSSVTSAESVERDPANASLTRFPMRRLDAEAVRDSMLAVSGRLGSKSEGPYVPTTRNGDGEVVVDEGRPDAFSRSVFLQQRRTQVATMLQLFDAPAIVFNCTRRASTTMPLQSLGLLNSEFAVARGRDFGERIRREGGDDDASRVRRGFLLAFGREPDKAESLMALEFIASQRSHHEAAAAKDVDVRTWADFAQSLMAMNAFLYLE